MATESGRDGRPVSERLVREPGRFCFFQAVRLLERLAFVQARRGRGPRRAPVGTDAAPESEAARFHTVPSHAFPGVDVEAVRPASGQRVDNLPGPPPDVSVPFMGLVGPLGALPQHYTRLILSRDREKDRALRDLLDLFQHRLISLFYRAWEKSHFTEAYARRAIDPSQDEDLLTYALYSMVGMAAEPARGGDRIDHEVYLRYNGLFADRRRNAVSLQRILQDYLRLPVDVRQFQGEWLALLPEEQSCLHTTSLNSGARLGESTILGSRVWSLQGKFRLRLGPFSYATARRFLPTGDRLEPMCELVRAYVGGEFRFDVQLVIFRDDVPQCRLGGDPHDASHLGWNAWVQSQPFERDVEDAVFEGDRPVSRGRRLSSQPPASYTVDFVPDASQPLTS